MDRRTFGVRLGLLAAVGLAGCLGGEEAPYADAVAAFNSALDLRDDAARAAAAGTDAMDREAWVDAEAAFNRGRSRYSRARGRFSEARTEARGCDELVAAASAMVARCADMERACGRWLEAAAAYRTGDPERGRTLRERGEEWASEARRHPLRDPLAAGSVDC